MQKFSVDRIEGDFAICDGNGERISVPVSKLPGGTKEGDIIGMTDDVFVALPDETAARKKSLYDLQKSLFKK